MSASGSAATGKSGDASQKGGGSAGHHMSQTAASTTQPHTTGGNEPGSGGTVAGAGSAVDPNADSSIPSGGTTQTGKPVGQ
ncbi:hypothetical protein H2203_004025 [Taxawa tesnikishii (nom. ined.)]|nr:hypothetical protein H2203_004025 [Dothideales sp. JES 119]